MKKTVVQPENVAVPASPYVPAVVAGGFAFVSGQIGAPTAEDGAPSSIEEQTRDAVARLEEILRACGSGLEQIVRATVYLADIADFDRFNAAYREVMPQPWATRVTVQAALARPEFRVEIDAIAVVADAVGDPAAE